MSPEKENTFRMLRDERPLKTSIWCSLGIHKWTKWSKPDTLHAIWAKQDRECINCGEYEFKKTRVN